MPFCYIHFACYIDEQTSLDVIILIPVLISMSYFLMILEKGSLIGRTLRPHIPHDDP